MGQSGQQEPGVTGRLQLGRKERGVLVFSPLPSFIQSDTAVHGTVPPTFRMGLPPQLAQSRAATQTRPEVCLLSNSGPCVVDNQYQPSVG